ncbi:QcrA and Rieske domain-containing protein [Trichothermofontia sp.]
MKRRDFIGWVGVGGVVSSLPAVLSACDANQTATTAASPTPPIATGTFEVVGAVAALDNPGGLLNKDLAEPVLVIRDPANPDTLLAVNPTCTHEGCTVDWKGDAKAFVCPCHDARFSKTGTPLQGPADKPLATYAAKIEGDRVLVNLG